MNYKFDPNKYLGKKGTTFGLTFDEDYYTWEIWGGDKFLPKNKITIILDNIKSYFYDILRN